MDPSILLCILFLSTMFTSIKGFESNCQTLKCSDSSPHIHFPFQESSQQQQNHCGHPGFELSCQANKTMIHFPNYGELVVKSISYKIKKLDLLDPKNCVHEVFLNLNLSKTPYQYYYLLKNYTYLNCSTQLSSPFIEIPCLSGKKHHLYTVEPSSLPVVPASCISVKTVAIPFAFSPYLADCSFGLGLTWSLPEHEDSEINALIRKQDKGFSMKNMIMGDFETKFLMVGLCILAVAIVAMHKSKKMGLQQQIEKENVNEILIQCPVNKTNK